MPFVVATLYHFFDFPHYADMRPSLLEALTSRSIRGSLLIAPEGINGTLAGTREAIDQFLDHLRKEVIKGDFEHKESFCENLPFTRTKVRLKQETISLGESVSLANVGTYVDAQQWNDLLDDPETIVIDTRNNYEVHLGTFDRAINPNISSFKKLPAYIRETLGSAKHKKIAAFCTGGIRCEKFTAWMKEHGYKEVYHLKGGILRYIEETPQEKSKWRGDCYVFDDRIALNHRLEPSEESGLCTACDHTLTAQDMEHPDYVENERCPYC